MSKKFSYNFIVNPKTGRKVLTHGKIGKSIINGFLSNLNGGKQMGGGLIFDRISLARLTKKGVWAPVNPAKDDAWEQHLKMEASVKWEEIKANIEFLRHAKLDWDLGVKQKQADEDDEARQREGWGVDSYTPHDDDPAYSVIRTTRLNYNREERQSKEREVEKRLSSDADQSTMVEKTEETEETVTPDSFIYGTGL